MVARTRGKLKLNHDHDRIEQIAQPGCINPSRKTRDHYEAFNALLELSKLHYFCLSFTPY